MKFIITLSAATLLLAAGLLSVVQNAVMSDRIITRTQRLPAILFLLALSAGFFISLGLNRGQPAWSGLPADSVSSISGRAVSDSRRLSSGKYLLEIDLKRVEAKNGASADAGGKLLLFIDTNPEVYKGRLLDVDTQLYSSDSLNSLMQLQHAGGRSLLKEPAVFTSNAPADAIVRGGWSSPAAKWRAVSAEKIARRCSEMGFAAGGLFAALFSGNRDGLSVRETNVFRRAGCSHILALSGMHLGILSGIILLLLKPLPGRRAAFLISCVLIAAYLYLTGFGVSLVRAAVMYFFCGAAMVSHRRFRGLDVLLLSFVVVVIINPASFYTAAFRLSFLAVGGILIASPILNRLLRPVLPSFLAIALAVSFGAQLFVAPLLADLFGAFFPIGIVAGIILAPMVTVFIWIGIIFLITGWGFIAGLADWLYRLIFFTAEKASGFPSFTVENKSGIVLIVCSFLGLLLIFYSLYRRRMDGISG